MPSSSASLRAPVPAALEDHMFRLMVERVQDYAIFILDKDGHVRSWNSGATKIKQYQPREIIGKHFSIFYTQEDITRQWPQQELQRATVEGRFEDTGWRVRKDGSRMWANVIITALRDEQGQLLGFSKITRDLTTQKLEQEEMRRSEERFRLLVDGVEDYAIYLLSADGIVTSWNLGAHRIKGYEASEIIGRHFSSFYQPCDIAAGKPWAELAVARESGRAEDEGWRVRKDGTKFWARVVVTALHDGDGVLYGFAKVTQDLTQRRHSEALEIAAEQLNDFIAVLAHELRNPLAPIRNAAHLLPMARFNDKQFDTLHRAVDRQSAHLARIVDDLLDVSRITRATLTVNRMPLNMREVIERSVEAALPEIEAAKHELVADIADGELPVQGDIVRLSQALTNLLINASRYTDPGGRITLSAGIARDSRPAMVEIRVSDNGRGIDPKLIHSIFGMFVQSKDASAMQTGLGIGLALARTITELHHGTLEVSSEGLNKGSTFILRIPCVKGAKPQPAVAPVAKAAPAAALPSKRVLVVDDNVDAATVFSSVLRSMGHEVLTVNDGVAALTVTETFRPEVIMLDLGMPGMNGFEVARKIRECRRNPEPLIVAVTGWGKAEDERRTREAGFDLHLMKPVEVGQLGRVFESAPRARQ